MIYTENIVHQIPQPVEPKDSHQVVLMWGQCLPKVILRPMQSVRVGRFPGQLQESHGLALAAARSQKSSEDGPLLGSHSLRDGLQEIGAGHFDLGNALSMSLGICLLAKVSQQ